MKISTIYKVIVLVFLLSGFWYVPTHAQETGRGWSEPYRLSTSAGKASEASLVSDPYGYVHAFWTEEELETQNVRILYSRFDGETWTEPNDIIIPTGEIENVSPAIDQEGILHILWTQGLSGPVFYSHAPAGSAQTASSWSEPVRVDIPGGIVRLKIDSQGIFHVVYINRGAELGVYYTRSEDQGANWSEPRWLDPDIPVSHTPSGLNFEIDKNGGLHAAWNYVAMFEGLGNHEMVRYSHSLDGGATWTNPFTIDEYIEGIDYQLGFAEPRMIVQDDFVHIVWAAGSYPYRHHRYSSDRGETWSPPEQIFGELHGQAGDGLTVDGAGRVHFFGQIRYPLGIYHAIWDQNGWTPPELIYMISQGEFQPLINDRIHAHTTYPIIRSGNQIVLTFTDGPADPNRRLFAMVNTLDDVSPIEPAPTPEPRAALPVESSPTPQIQSSVSTLPAESSLSGPENIQATQSTRPDFYLWITLASNLVFFGAVLFYQFVLKGKYRKNSRHE